MRVRIAAAVVTTALFGVALTGCSTGVTATDCAPTESGANSSLVTVGDATSSAPSVSFPTPLYSTDVETTVIERGDGAPIAEGDTVSLSYVSANGTTGEVTYEAGWADGASPALQLAFRDGAPQVILDALGCVPAGSTVAVTSPYDTAFGDGAAEQAGEDPATTFVFVFHVDSVTPGRATGSPQWVTTPGLPAVALAPDGTPGVTIPKSDPPTSFTAATLLGGNGPVVAEGDTVQVQYSGFLWTERTQFDTTWDDQVPASFTLDGTSVVPGFQQAIVGQKVGSQVIAVLPPDLAYGEAGSGSIPANATLVFVIDIVGVTPAE